MFDFQGLIDRHKNVDDTAYELIRIFLGAALLIRGILFMTNQSTVMEMVEQQGMDWLLPMIEIHYITLAHLCGGVMLMLGLLTRVAAFVQIPILVGAVFFIHLQDGLFTQGQSFELSVLVLFLLGIVFVFGSGKYSLDHYIFARQGEDDPQEILRRVQQSASSRRERVLEEIRLKKEQAESGAVATLVSEQVAGIDGEVVQQERRSIARVFYTILAYGLVFSLLVSLIVLDVITIPRGLPIGALVGGGLVVFLLLGMFFLIYGSALNESG